ncbi:hypothetical protein MP638_001329, partial [Amoeboaphelidium occidentale]
IKSWQLGTLRSQIKKSSLDTEIQKVVLIRIQNVVKLVNRAAQAALLIVELFLHDVQNNLLIENELLFGVSGGEKVWSNLLSYLLLPEKRGKKGPRLFQIIKKFIEDYELGLSLSEEELEYVPFCSGNVLQMHAKSIDSMVARHLIGSAPLLAQAVETYVPDNAEIAQELLECLVVA